MSNQSVEQQKLNDALTKTIPAEFITIISPSELQSTLDQLEVTGTELVKTGQAKEASTNGKGTLLKQKRNLETSIKLTESEAIMQIQGSGKDAFVMVSGVKQSVGTESLKDAYRRNCSASQRQELARVEGDIMEIEAGAIQANDAWFTAKEAAENVRAKAGLQAALLNFLTPRS